MAISIFNTRWHGIKGETVGEGKFAMSVVRVQTTKDGAWQALNEEELNKLINEHNQNLHVPRFDLKAQVKKLGSDSLLPPAKKKAKKGKKK